MGQGIYRDALLGMRARLAELDTRIADREAHTSVELLGHLPTRLRARIVELRGDRRPRGDSLEDLTRAESSSASYLEALEAAHAMVPALEAKLRAIPERPPRLKKLGRCAMLRVAEDALTEVLATVRDVVTRVVARHDRDAAVAEDEDDFAFAAELRALGTPIAMLVECFVDPNRPYEPRVQVGTTIARAMPRVVLRPETWGQAIAKVMGFRRDIAVGDESFDGRFLVDADAWAARRLLNAEVRTALLAIARDDVPALSVENGKAILSWSFEPTERALDAAFFVLGRLRAMQVSLKLAS